MQARPPLSRRDSSCSMGSDYSDRSDYSRSTAPTNYSGYPQLSRDTRAYSKKLDADNYYLPENDCASVLTYASTTPSDAGWDDDNDNRINEYDEYPQFEPEEDARSTSSSGDCDRDYNDRHHEPSALPSTPNEFAQCFPSSRRMYISHDDTVDGNMNLRLDTNAELPDGRRVALTLFHLRMHDLKNRDFSLRRYCRDSGREVCHSSRKYVKPSAQRKMMPSIQQSIGSAFGLLRSKSDFGSHKDKDHAAAESAFSRASLKRTDSGYDSMSDDDEVAEPANSSGNSSAAAAAAALAKEAKNLPIPTNTTNLEFSNYCHMDLRRRGATSSKRYDFNYWGSTYAWRRRVVRKTIIRDAGSVGKGGKDSKMSSTTIEEVSYHLYSTSSKAAVAHIVPTPLTPEEKDEEEANGGWVPQCSFWIADGEALRGKEDIADVIVATGLLALVDDSIKTRWHRKDRFRVTLPFASSPAGNNATASSGFGARNNGSGQPSAAARKLIEDVFGKKSPIGVNKSMRSPMRRIAPRS